MTTPELPAHSEANTEAVAPFRLPLAELSRMDVDQLRDESARLHREQTKLAVQIMADLVSAMQRRFPGPLEQAVEKTSDATLIPSDTLWLQLRTDYLTRVPSRLVRDRNRRTFQETFEFVDMILSACSPVDSNAYTQTLTLAGRLHDLALQRARVLDQREILQQREAQLRREQELKERERQREVVERRVVYVNPNPPAVVPDAPGGSHHKPDPLAAANVAEFVESLSRLRVWAGEVSLRELARRSPESIAHSTFGAMLNNPDKLPAQRTVRLFVHALGCDEAEVQSWVTAWRELRFKPRGCRVDSTVTVFRRSS